MQNSRNQSLDALRGFAILTMVLSGSIAFGDVLPAWMYHAQVPPPNHTFIPTIPGITWVDLVFPFFLFSMGAAIPLSLNKQINEGLKFSKLLIIAFKRFALLAFFALFTQHMKAWVIAEQPTIVDHLLSIVAFVLLFFQLYENKIDKYKKLFIGLKIASFIVAIIFLYKLPFWKGEGFNFYKSDIIIMVLANMAFFGTIIYYFTHKNWLLRLGLLPFIMAIFLAAKEPNDNFLKVFFNFNGIGDIKIDWLYKFYFLKYLFIIIAGTLAGDWMKEKQVDASLLSTNKNIVTQLALGSFMLICFNVYALFTRQLLLNLGLSIALCSYLVYILKTKMPQSNLLKFAHAGTYLVLLGLFFEAYEGGIKKDSSTYSYYFVTSGLAFFALLLFSIVEEIKYLEKIIYYLSLNGKNPMVAYVAGSLILLPLLSITHLKPYWEAMQANAFMGFMKGILFTGIVSLITLFFVKRKWFWKT